MSIRSITSANITKEYSAMEEKRKFTRINFETPGIACFDNVSYNIKIIDLSIKSALFQIDDDNNIKVGDEGYVSIHISDKVTATLKIKVARIINKKIGVYCTSIDVESLAHLKTLFELNIGDPELFERNLSELLK